VKVLFAPPAKVATVVVPARVNALALVPDRATVIAVAAPAPAPLAIVKVCAAGLDAAE
jgi:hypothetical protein